MTGIPRILGGRYEIGDLIGRGGMAQVHLGYDTRLSRTIAIKILRSDHISDPTFVARFRREAQSAAALNHPSIVAVYDTGEETMTAEDGKVVSVPYIVMEYVKGRTVSKLLANGDALPIKEGVQIAVGVLSALEYSHREGIVHRDIKPGNIMITPDGKVKVMDFGIARAIAYSAATMTQTNSVVGTAQYLSPEQARGEVVDARSDLYSTGCLLYELLTGQPPFRGDSAVAVAYQHVSETPKPPREIAPDIPEAINRVVMKSLAKKREDRYQSADEMRSDLLAAARGQMVDAPAVTAWPTQVVASVPPMQATQVAHAVSTTDTAEAIASPEKPKQNRTYIILGVILLLLAAIGIGLAVHNSMNANEAPTTVVVPDMTGMDQKEARAALAEVGLGFKIGEPVEDEKIPAGEFVDSDPKVGAEVPPDTVVTVQFSAGVGEVTVPDLTGGRYNQDEARQALEELGLEVGRVDIQDVPGLERDKVYATDPEPNTKVEKGAVVNLVVASGEVVLPDLRGLTKDEAENLLREQQFPSVNFETQETTDAADGTVIEMYPGPGKVPYNQAIQIVIAKKPATPTPPPTTGGEGNPDADNG
ncbi:MAG: Stk1 family PASTA domain-containing Ser/Thr kinase [Trueperella sp.]|nr:Stk1 family PASTA domain-containing Ser/Thr kinase [Trueperella sp.]